MAKWLRCLAPKRELAGSSLRWFATKAGWPGRYINVRPCGGLSMVLLQLKDPLKLTLMVLVANSTNTKRYQKPEK